jgi:hypothetical protein
MIHILYLFHDKNTRQKAFNSDKGKNCEDKNCEDKNCEDKKLQMASQGTGPTATSLAW